MNHPRIGVVINPTAGAGRAASAGTHTLSALRDRGHDVVDLSTDDAASAERGAREAVRGGALDALVVVGGDGMVHLGVNACAGTGVPLGIVAAGSGNDTARALGLARHDVAASVEDMVRAWSCPRLVDAAHVTPADRWFVGVLSAGLDAAVSARAQADTRRSGTWRYVRAVAAELARFRPYGYRVTSAERVWEEPGTLVAVANGPAIGGGVRIAPTAVLDDGWLDVVLAPAFTRARAARIFPGMYRGRHLQVAGIETYRTRDVVLEPTGAGATPPRACADGEDVGPLPQRVQIHAGALAILALAPGATTP